MEAGMNALVLVAYRQIMATTVLIPTAYFLEWKSRPAITKSILLHIFWSSLGATVSQSLYFVGLKYTTPTVASALQNLIPAITFVMAIPFKMEKVGIAKVLGTTVSVGGAMLMILFKGNIISFVRSSIHWTYVESMKKSHVIDDNHSFLGPLLVIGSCIAGAGWLIGQVKMGETFPAPYTSSALICSMASFECVIIAIFQEHSISGWSLASGVGLVASVYSGIIGSVISFSIITWCAQKKGPLYVSMFSPLTLVIVATASWALLDEEIFLGTGVGSVLIVTGILVVLWGKMKEKTQASTANENKNAAV